MAQYDDDFAGKLKIAWDTAFKSNPKLILSLCGSASSWIEKNILKKQILSSGYLGRRIWLHYHCQNATIFWGKNYEKTCSFDKFTYLSTVGAIPKYLEEMIAEETAVQNINRLFFQPSGYLFLEFEKIFNDIFTSRAKTYKKIVQALVMKGLDAASIARSLGIHQSGDLTEYYMGSLLT